MYEKMTAFIPLLENDEFGRWTELCGDGSDANPYEWPHVDYSRNVRVLEKEVYHFSDAHPEYGLNRYSDILHVYGLDRDEEALAGADVSALDGVTVLAMLYSVIRAERFCDGALLDYCRSGHVVRWLKRLKEIDDGE